MHGEKDKWELHKNATCCFEEILEATLHKTAAVQPSSSYLKNHSSKMNKRYGILLEKQGQTHNQHSSMNPTHRYTEQKGLPYISYVSILNVV